MSAPAPGWYPDNTGVLRWWNGVQWTDATAPPPAPVPTPSAPYASAEPAKVPAGTPVYTRWIWWIVLLPMVTVIPLAGYLIDMSARMSAIFDQIADAAEGAVVDPSVMRDLTQQQLALILNPWYLAVVLTGLALSAVVIWFSYLDFRDLTALGYERPFHWAWAFLSPPLVYVIGRSVVVRRRSGRGLAPMWVLIGFQVALLVATIVWSFWFTAVLTQQMLAVIPTS